MTTLDALQNMRRLILSGKHLMPMGGDTKALMLPELLDEATGNDAMLSGELLVLLDSLSPGGNFDMYADGARWPRGAEGPTYHYDTSQAQLAAVVGKACMKAARPTP